MSVKINPPVGGAERLIAKEYRYFDRASILWCVIYLYLEQSELLLEKTMPKPIRAILCDVDGTFIDSFRHGLYKLKLGAERAGLHYDDAVEHTAVSIWGATLINIFAACFPDATQEQIDIMLDVFKNEDAVNPPSSFDGVHAVFDVLGELGIVFTVVTSRDSESLDIILKNDKLDHYFCHVAAEDTVEHRKPDPRVFACTMRELAKRGIEPDECLMIGDTYDDFRAGTRFGMKTVIVKTGPLSENQADIPEEDHIQSFAELPDWLRKNNLLPT